MPPEALAVATDTTFSVAELIYHWRQFGDIAKQSGISLADPGDYLPWWEIYLAGAWEENQRI